MKSVSTSWPWMSLVLSVVAILSPWGREFVWAAFLSGEELSRNIARPIVFAGAGALLLIISLEYLLRRMLLRRR